MSSLRSVNTDFWEDNFIIELEPDEKLLFLYLLSNSKTNMLGVYEIHIKKICFDTGLEKERVRKAFEGFERVKKVKYLSGYVILQNFIKHQSFNPNMETSAIRTWNNLPIEVRKSPFCKPILKALKGFTKASEPIAKIELEYELELERELEEEYELENESEPETGAHAREEISEIMAKRSEDSESIPGKEEWFEYLMASLRYSKNFAEHLWDHLMTKGWSVGDPPQEIKDWRAYARKQRQWAYEYDQKEKKLKSNTHNHGSHNESTRDFARGLKELDQLEQYEAN